MRWLAVVAALWAAVGCSSEDGTDPVDPLGFAVDQPGPFRVGYQSFDVSYTPPTATEPRTIEISVWYPTEDTEGYSPSYHDLFRDNDAFEDAIPAAPVHANGYPVQVYSHGRMGFGGTSSAIMRYFASHGWVAVAPSHTNDTLFGPDEFPASHYFERSTDISHTLDVAAELDLAGPVDTSRVLLSGHSFGAYTAWASAGAEFDEAAVRAKCADVPTGPCTEDEIAVLLGGLGDDRVVATMPMAGGDSGFFGAAGYDVVDVPVLYMTGTDDQVGQQSLFDKVSGVDLTWLDIEGGCHQLFGLGGCDSIDAIAVGFPIVNTYALAFARHHVLGDDQEKTVGILDGSIEVSDLVSYEAKQ